MKQRSWFWTAIAVTIFVVAFALLLVSLSACDTSTTSYPQDESMEVKNDHSGEIYFWPGAKPGQLTITPDGGLGYGIGSGMVMGL